MNKEAKGFPLDYESRTLERQLVDLCRKFHNAKLIIVGNPDKHTITFRIESK